MTDLASLALKIDSSDVTPAVNRLDDLTRAGDRAEKQTNDLGRAAKSAGRDMVTMGQAASRSRSGVQQLGFQINDFATQVSTGINPMIAFAQQSGQMGFALSQMGGSLGKVGAFLMGPWGIAVLTATTVLSGFIGAALESSKAQDEQADAAKKLAKETAALDEALGRAIKTQQQLRVETLNTATAMRQQIADTIALQKAHLQGALDQQRIQQRRFGAVGGSAFSAVGLTGQALNEEKDARTALTRLDGELEKAERRVRLAQIPIENSRIDATYKRNGTAIADVTEKIGRLEEAYASDKITLDVRNAQYDKLKGQLEKLEAPVERHRKGVDLAAKAEREASKAARELESDLQSIISALDPATASWGRYQEQLEKIAKLRAAGKLSPEDADALGIKAGLAELKSEQKQWADTVKEMTDGMSIEFKSAGAGLGAAWLENVHPDVEKLVKLFQKDGVLPTFGGPSNIAGDVREVFGQGLGDITDALERQGMDLNKLFEGKIFGKNGLFKQGFGEVLQSIAASAQLGKGITDLLGIKGSKTGATIGAGLGKAASAVTGIPGLDQVGAILGSIVGGLFKKVKYGRAGVAFQDGSLQIVGGGGNSSSAESAAKSAANSLIGGLNQISEALGGTLGDFGKIVIGQRDKKWRVNLDGGSLKTGKGAKDFGKGDDAAQAAIEYAISEAIKRGALIGLRESTKTLLTKGEDFQTALTKALKWEDVFHDLSQRLDPVGTAIADLNKQFDQLRKIATEAGASTEELAKLEQDYALQKADAVKQASQAADDLRRQGQSIQAQILDLQGREREAAALTRQIELETMDASLHSLARQLYAWQDYADAKDKFQPFVDSLTAFKDTLFGDSSGGLTRNAALAKLVSVGALAATGDTTALGQLQGAGSDFLTASKNKAGTLAQYQRDVALVARYVDQGVAAAQSQIDYAKVSAENLTSVVDLLTSIDMSLAPGGTGTPGALTTESPASLEQLQLIAAQNLQTLTGINQLVRLLTRWDRGPAMAVTADTTSPLPVDQV